ncbi:MAG: SRPBCC domain-containing protein [Planctomycetota bacterium]
MTDRTTQPDNTVRLNKLVQASPEQVYDTWLDVASYAKWFAPEPSVTCSEVTIDANVGGQMRVVMQSDSGTHTGIATFTELVPGKRIAYTWGWLENPEMGAGSTVTLDFFEADNPYGDGPATEIILTHGGLNTPVERSEHTGGWWGCLKALGYFVRGVDPREVMYGQAAKA